MFLPICFENDDILIKPLHPGDLNELRQLAREVYNILSDEETLQFIPEKRLASVSEAEGWLKGAILNFYSGRNFLHLIRERATGKLLGMVDILSPEKAEEYYLLDNYPYFVEFYLKSKARGRKIMSGILPVILNELSERDIRSVGVVIDPDNAAALKVARRSGFEYRSPFDARQNLYLLPLSA